MQAMYPLVGLPLENLPMIGEDASPSRQRAWECSQRVQEDVVKTFQPNTDDLLRLTNALTCDEQRLTRNGKSSTRSGDWMLEENILPASLLWTGFEATPCAK